MSGEMAKVVVQYALFDDDSKLSSLVVPAVAYTGPEYATVGLFAEDATSKASIDNIYCTSLKYNDSAITASDTNGGARFFVRREQMRLSVPRLLLFELASLSMRLRSQRGMKLD